LRLRGSPPSEIPYGFARQISDLVLLCGQLLREERLAKYEQVVALRKQGFSQTAIAEQGGIGHMTVSRWLAHGAFPEYQSPLRKTGVDVHLPYLRERWQAGCHNMAQVYRERLERG